MIPSKAPSNNGIVKGLAIVRYVVVDIRVRRKAPAAAAYTHYICDNNGHCPSSSQGERRYRDEGFNI